MTLWLTGGPGFTERRIDLDKSPSPTVMVGGISAGSDHEVVDDGRDTYRPDPHKPPYRVPSMDEIRAVPWNGLDAVSTFSGCGGSSLGYRMAGFRVLWANEFVEAARASYAANKAPYTVLDGRDIRELTPGDVLGAIGRAPGELDLLDGSPPCASFSTAGKREKHWGKSKSYSDRAQRTDDLFFEFARLLRGIRPKTFVAENVSGLVKGTAKGYFLEILAELKSCGYRVEARLLDAQWLGVPQARQRLIFVGVRSGFGLAPAFPKPLPYRYSVRDALPWIGRCIVGNEAFKPVWGSADVPSPTIVTGPHGGSGMVEVLPISPEERRPGSRVVHDTSGDWGVGDITDRPCPAVTVGVNSINSNHFRVETEADISRYAVGSEWDKLKPGEQSDRYFQLVRAPIDGPSPTVTASGGTSSLASVTHPTERRKFSIAELRRICGFPDDFRLVGSYAQQWERLGRAVPPVMMSRVASAVRDGVLLPLKARDAA